MYGATLPRQMEFHPRLPLTDRDEPSGVVLEPPDPAETTTRNGIQPETVRDATARIRSLKISLWKG